MAAPIASSPSIWNLWEVLSLFLIPVGGGIPAGVLLAKSRNVEWPVTVILYFVSDVVLACVFEPLMLLMIAVARRVRSLARFGAALKASMAKTTSLYGSKAGPLALILVAFGVDPMTGRAAAVAAGHGFVTGWMLAIAGDMLFFGVLMVSTLWLDSVIGDSARTTAIILVAMLVLPALVRRVRGRSGVKAGAQPEAPAGRQ